MTFFAPEIYQERRQQLMQSLGSGLILLLGNEESPMNYTDNTYPFRQDSNFLYFCGVDRPHVAMLIDIEAGTSTLFGDDPSVDSIVWTGPQTSMAELGQLCGTAHHASYSNLPKALEAARSKQRPIHYLPPYRHDNAIKLHEWLEIPLRQLKEKASTALIKAIIAQASYKSPVEVAEMEKAVNTSQKMHVAVMQNVRAGMIEAELAGLVEGLAISGGGRLAYSAILTVNGQTLHNHHHHNVLREGQLILGDFGAETVMRYAGDITRTVPVSKTFTQQQKEVYNIVLESQLDAIAALKPGVPYRDVHLLACKTIASGLKDLGLMKGDAGEAVAAGAHALFFPHGLGHMIGLDVHDMEDLGEDLVGYDETITRSTQFGLRSLRLGRKLETGFVITVEPGIYFIPELIDQWEAKGTCKDFINFDKLKSYRHFSGIRIEDDILITENGYRILGDPIPKTVAEIEEQRS
ncbi:MAG: aminopeptidase P family protein [Bacteroidota bacterium]